MWPLSSRPLPANHMPGSELTDGGEADATSTSVFRRKASTGSSAAASSSSILLKLFRRRSSQATDNADVPETATPRAHSPAHSPKPAAKRGGSQPNVLSAPQQQPQALARSSPRPGVKRGKSQPVLSIPTAQEELPVARVVEPMMIAPARRIQEFQTTAIVQQPKRIELAGDHSQPKPVVMRTKSHKLPAARKKSMLVSELEQPIASPLTKNARPKSMFVTSPMYLPPADEQVIIEPKLVDLFSMYPVAKKKSQAGIRSAKKVSVVNQAEDQFDISFIAE